MKPNTRLLAIAGALASLQGIGASGNPFGSAPAIKGQPWGPFIDSHGPPSRRPMPPLPKPPTEYEWAARMAEAKRIKQQRRKARR